MLAVQFTLPEFDFVLHLQHEWRALANLAGLLLGFAPLAAHFAGVFPAARSVGSWLRHGWRVAVGFGLGFLAMYVVFGFHPHDLPRG